MTPELWGDREEEGRWGVTSRAEGNDCSGTLCVCVFVQPGTERWNNRVHSELQAETAPIVNTQVHNMFTQTHKGLVMEAILINVCGAFVCKSDKEKMISM